MDKPAKVLLSGDVGGALTALMKRVEAVNSKNGPFDLLLCVGSFFPPGGDEPDAQPPADMLPYLTGEAQPPVPTYFIGAYGRGSGAGMAALAAAGDKCGLKYLGRAGVVEVKGLNLAFLDGRRPPRAPPAAAGELPPPPPAGGLGAPYYTPAELEVVRRDLAELAGDVDVLLTCEWPAGLLGGLPGEQATVAGMQPAACAPAAADLAVLARPRYHVAGGQGVFYARPPYANPDLGAGPRATRFVGLAHVGNAGKHKFLHALGLAPAGRQTPEQLSALPEGVTPCPFGRGEKRPGGAPAEDEGVGGYRWAQPKRPRADRQQQQGGGGGGGDGAAAAWGNAGVVKDSLSTVYVKNLPFAATMADVEGLFLKAGKVVDVRRGVDDHGRPKSWAHVQFDCPQAVGNALALDGSELLGRPLSVEPANQGAPRAPAGPAPAQPVDGCWFCLSSDGVDVNLVASVGDEAYVALDKGQITPTHALVVPIEHYPSLVSLPPAGADEVLRYLSSLRAAFASQGLQLVGFERHLALRGKGGNHAHINVVGVSPEAAGGARAAFEQQAAAAGFELEHVPPKDGQLDRAALAAAAGGGEYFLGLLPDGGSLVRPIRRGERFPMHLGRQILAGLAGAPERADWRACAKDGPAEEEAEAERFKAMYRPFDIMQQGE
ncbi:MAG: CwfJ C-terminus 1-domain-containing protein-like protein [Monoraphidium minutum]|nr:MAG: CwfJ C-terminus 1-domain-containing protein-like protein [Monoraphidium minutum]